MGFTPCCLTRTDVKLFKNSGVKVGDLPESFETCLTGASIADLELWGDRILEAKTLTDVFD